MFQDVIVVEQPVPELRLRTGAIAFLPRLLAALLAADDKHGAALAGKHCASLSLQGLQCPRHNRLVKLLRGKAVHVHRQRGRVVLIPDSPKGRIGNHHIHAIRRLEVHRVLVGNGEALFA